MTTSRYKVYVGRYRDRVITLLIEAQEVEDGNGPGEHVRPGVEDLEFQGDVEIDGPGVNALPVSLTDGYPS